MVGDALSSQHEDVASLVVRRVRGDAEGAGEGEHAVLARADPLATDLHDLAVGQRVVERSPADTVAGLEDEDGRAGGHQDERRGQPGEAPAHDADIGFFGERRYVHGNLLGRAFAAPQET